MEPSAASAQARQVPAAADTAGGGQAVGEFFAVLDDGWRLTADQRARLAPAVQAALDAGWMPHALAAFTGANTAGVRNPYAVLAARLSPAELPPQQRQRPARPPWCGQCDEVTRMLDFDGDAPRPCPHCKPWAAASRAARRENRPLSRLSDVRVRGQGGRGVPILALHPARHPRRGPAAARAEPAMWCATENRTMAGPGAVVGGDRQGQPGAHAADPHAGGQEARPAQRPAATHSAPSTRSLPPAGTECKNSTAAQPTASTGAASYRASSGCSRICRMTGRMRLALIRYTVMLFMPSACPRGPARGVGRGWESGLIPASTPGSSRSCDPAAAVPTIRGKPPIDNNRAAADPDHQPSRGLVEDIVADQSAQVTAPHKRSALDNGRFPYTGTNRPRSSLAPKAEWVFPEPGHSTLASDRDGNNQIRSVAKPTRRRLTGCGLAGFGSLGGKALG